MATYRPKQTRINWYVLCFLAVIREFKFKWSTPVYVLKIDKREQLENRPGKDIQTTFKKVYTQQRTAEAHTYNHYINSQSCFERLSFFTSFQKVLDICERVSVSIVLLQFSIKSIAVT